MSIKLDATQPVDLSVNVLDKEGNVVPESEYTVAFSLENAVGDAGVFDSTNPNLFNPGASGATGTLVATVTDQKGDVLKGSLDFELEPGAPASVVIDVKPDVAP